MKHFTNYIPSDVNEPKRPFTCWKVYETTHYKKPIPKDAPRGIVCGLVSDGLEVLDFDNHNGCLFSDFVDELAKQRAGLVERLTIETSPSGGYHIYYRCNNPDNNKKLARNEEGQATIETRGERGFIVCAPTRGYKLVQGTHDNAPKLTDEERALLWSVARSFDKYETPNKSTLPTTRQRSNEDETSPAAVLRTRGARAYIKRALTNAGYIWKYSTTSDDFGGGDYYYHENANDDKEKLVLSNKDNFLHLFASSQYGGLERANSDDLTPLEAVSLLECMSIEDAAALVRRELRALFPVDTSAIIYDDEIEDDDEDEEPEDDTPTLDNVEGFFDNNRAIFPPFIVDSVDAFERRTVYPQRTLYAFTLFAICGLFTDTKTNIKTASGFYLPVRTRLHVFNIAETAGGKDGVRTSLKKLFIDGKNERYKTRGLLEYYEKEGDKDVKKFERPPKSFIENVTSQTALFTMLGESATYDRRQQERDRSADDYTIKHGRALGLVMVDEAADVLAGGSTKDTVKREAFAALKRLAECSDDELVTLDDGHNIKDTLRRANSDTIIKGPIVGLVMFAPFGIAEELKTADFGGGFINRFLYVIGDRRERVYKGGSFNTMSPSRITEQERQVIEVLAARDNFPLTLPADVKRYADKTKDDYIKTSKNANDLTKTAAARLAGRFESLVCLSAILRAAYNDETKQGQLDESKDIIISSLDVDFARACLGYFLKTVNYLTSKTIDDNVDARTRLDSRIEDAILDALTDSKNGRLKIETLRTNQRYGLRRLNAGRARINAAAHALQSTGAVSIERGFIVDRRKKRTKKGGKQ